MEQSSGLQFKPPELEKVTGGQQSNTSEIITSSLNGLSNEREAQLKSWLYLASVFMLIIESAVIEKAL